METQEAVTPKSFWKRLHSRYRYHTVEIRMWWNVRKERLWMALAWRLPHQLIVWAVVRMWSHGTMGIYGDTHPDKLTYGEASRRWRTDNHERDPR